ncbi:hypothetical protein EG329_014065 [Mollisiaceae sp. DMI_Dod_QoI]|nr:hypothetical protein EG329_014065 [Helotiales sp. DMI_Dod_QoI]
MFEPFQRLPLEIRSEIWLAAMPESRLVRLEERITEQYNEEEYNKDVYSKFYVEPRMVHELDQAYLDCEDLEYDEGLWTATDICYARTSIPSLYKIDPGLQHFSQAWKYPNRKPEGKLQTQLESYKFTSSRPRPELPLHLLTDCENTYQVFDATRRGYLWSSCPIPALLHTCRESRDTMKRAGYELTFRHRTAGPRTWFNFHHDILYLSCREHRGCEDDEISRSLDQGPWNIGQLSPDDLKRVEKLALAEVYDFREDCQSHAVRLFGNLKEFLLVRHHRCTKPEKELWDPDYQEAPGEDRWGHVETEDALWRFLPYAVADMFSSYWLDRGPRFFQTLRGHLRDNGGSEEDFWPSVEAKVEVFLKRQKEVALMCDIPLWNIPKVRIGQIVTEAQAKEIFNDREEYAKRAQNVGESAEVPTVNDTV